MFILISIYYLYIPTTMDSIVRKLHTTHMAYI